VQKTWTWAFIASPAKYDVDRIIEVCNATGVKALEYGPGGVEGMRESELKELRDRYAAAGIAINSFHLPFNADDDIASFYETQRRGAVRRMSRWMEVAGHLGCRVVIQHPSTNRYPAAENGLERYLDQLQKSIEELLPTARSAGVIIGLENMTPGESGGRFFAEAEHIRMFAARVNDPNVGFVYDTGHGLLSAGPRALDILEAMGERVVAWHLADNSGDRDSHLAPGHGEVDWDGVFRFAARIKFSAPVTMETPPWGPGPNYPIEAWKRTVEDLDALVARALAQKSA